MSDNENEYKSPVYNVKAVPVEKVVANDYNPNVVAPPEMKLLEYSFGEDGRYAKKFVGYGTKKQTKHILADGSLSLRQ